VNKTTIYRRWPTKSDLVRATLGAFARVGEQADTGNLREDLVAHFAHVATLLRSPVGRGLVRTLQLERADPELDRVLREHRATQHRVRVGLFQRARERGELPYNADLELLAELVAAPIASRAKQGEQRVDRAFLEATIDVVLAGAAASARRRAR
ncbi:MAG TPA: TetR-like C-terminal domain-containing protein, partial [Polyangiales bacterium]|nr:TetR-like C-terminal domain-containing protein [Polyangiales bacterium]